MTADHEFDPADVLDQIVAASERLLDTTARLSDADVRAPSLLPGWSRGHVLTHLARNADGGSNLLVWARTGVETPEYPSMAARAEQIEAGAGRRAEVLLADVCHSAARFAAEYARMPEQAWNRIVRWTGGTEHPAARAADSRLCEVLVHHVDLGAAYTPAQWPVHGRRKRFRHIISGMPTSKLKARLLAMAVEVGLAIVAADPAYTSQWGAQHWQKPMAAPRRTTTRHDAASIAIGRRALGHPIRRRTTPPPAHQSDVQGHRTIQAASDNRGRQETRPPATDHAPTGRSPTGKRKRETSTPNTVRGAPVQLMFTV
jgi:uncharacterized protein (TIGR03083 family)